MILIPLVHEIPRQRQYFHDLIDKEQTKADYSDGVRDNAIYYSEDTLLSYILTKAILKDVDRIQIMIENMPTNGREAGEDNQVKIGYLKAVWEMLRQYNADNKVDPYFYKKLVANIRDLLVAVNENKVMDFVKTNSNIYTLSNGKLLLENHQDARAYLYIELGKEHPIMMIKRLNEYANDTFADDIISDAAHVLPSVIF